ncbi:MAG: glycosyl transferase [Parcubacteria group bacterium GW2011_GWA2_38_13b]|nr:MAG: glycosyl transferase [Parcubacteria group bacterium GW2011_GWA2_38_13b]
MLLSIIIPIYNEEKTVESIIQKLEELYINNCKKEIILVNDGSTDKTDDVLKKYDKNHRIITHKVNRGKGAAIRSGIQASSGNIIIIQDADLEYDPSEIPLLLEPILNDKADVVYGSRFFGGRPHRVLFFWHYAGNKILTLWSNIFTNLNLTDMETGYKAFRSDIIKKIPLKSNRFGVEVELTAKIAKTNARIYEIGISYYGRKYSEGKKITWKDGLKAIFLIVWFKFFD